MIIDTDELKQRMKEDNKTLLQSIGVLYPVPSNGDADQGLALMFEVEMCQRENEDMIAKVETLAKVYL